MYPAPQGRVSDYAGVLDAHAKSSLDQIIQDVDQKTGAEIAVVCINSLDGAGVEEYANGLFKAWGIGKKDKDNGVLLLVAVQDHKMRIEVGYRLEPILPDGLAGEVLRTDLGPALRQGDYAGGIQLALEHIARILTGEERAPAIPLSRHSPAVPGGTFDVLAKLALLGMFVGIGGFFLGLGYASRNSFFVIFGAGFGGIPLAISFLIVYLSHLPIHRYVLLPGWGLLMMLAGVLWRRSKAYQWWIEQQAKGAAGRSSSSDRSIGSHSGGGGRGSSGGGGFGGGRSGGGGASGDW
jgi:uncharacterized protein